MSSQNQSSAVNRVDSDDEKIKFRLKNIKKQFGRVVALQDVNLDIREGEILALVGDNGAGKSTLLGILNGLHRPTDGKIYLDGQPVSFGNPQDARELGIETVYQDLALMNDLDVATNIFMGTFPQRGIWPFRFIDWDETYRLATQLIGETLQRDIPVTAEVDYLSGGERQLVAIARALAFDPEVVVLDEPTSALAVNATRLVHDTIRQLKTEGHTVVVVSHSIDSVLELADRIGVLYQGKLVTVTDPESTDLERLNEAMISGSLPE